jgi:exodeoxyribonuclease VII small subunit
MAAVNRPKKKATPNVEDAPATFEQTLQRLAQIVDQLEGGELPLEKSVQLFEEGMKLSRTSQAILDDAERRVEELLGFDERGQPIVKALPLDEEEDGNEGDDED